MPERERRIFQAFKDYASGNSRLKFTSEQISTLNDIVGVFNTSSPGDISGVLFRNSYFEVICKAIADTVLQIPTAATTVFIISFPLDLLSEEDISKIVRELTAEKNIDLKCCCEIVHEIYHKLQYVGLS